MPYFSLIERQFSSTSMSEEDSSNSEIIVNSGPWCSSSNSSETNVASKCLLLPKSTVPESPATCHPSKPFAGATKPHVSKGADHLNPAEGKRLEPDWHALLFGSRDVPTCQEILRVPEYDTYAEDCKLAEDVSLNYIAGIDLPACSILRDINHTRFKRILKKPCKVFPDVKDQAVALSLLLDYVSCCCQNGSLLTFYDKSKDSTKEYHLDKLLTELYYIAKDLKLDELLSMKKLVLASIARLPSHLKINHSFLTSRLERNIAVLEEEKKKKLSCPVYDFSVDERKLSPVSKKPKKSSVVSTFERWMEEKMDSNAGLSKKKQTKAITDDLNPKKKSNFGLSAAEKKIQTGPTSLKQVQQSPEWRECSPFSDYSLGSDESLLARWLSPSPTSSNEGMSPKRKSQFTSTPEYKNKARFLCDRSSSDEEYTAFKTKHDKIHDLASRKILTPQKNVIQLDKRISNPNPKKEEQKIEVLTSDKNGSKNVSQFKFSSFSSDDSLPDIPITATVKRPTSVIAFQESSASGSVTAKPKNEMVRNVKSTPKPKSTSAVVNSLTNSSAKKQKGTILHYFNRMKNDIGSTSKVRSPLKFLQCETSRDVASLDVKASSKKLESEKTPKSKTSQKVPISFNGKKIGPVPPRPGPVCTSSDSEASSDCPISKAGTSGSSQVREPIISPYKTKMNTWNSSKYESLPQKQPKSSGLLLSPSKKFIQVQPMRHSKFSSPLKH